MVWLVEVTSPLNGGFLQGNLPFIQVNDLYGLTINCPDICKPRPFVCFFVFQFFTVVVFFFKIQNLQKSGGCISDKFDLRQDDGNLDPSPKPKTHAISTNTKFTCRFWCDVPTTSDRRQGGSSAEIVFLLKELSGEGPKPLQLERELSMTLEGS